jgi:hypothetical protein
MRGHSPIIILNMVITNKKFILSMSIIKIVLCLYFLY